MAGTLPATESLEVVKRVRTAETEWEERMGLARADQAARLARLTAEADATVAAARQDAEKERTRVVEAARAEGDREAGQILAQGRTEAQQAGTGGPGGVSARRAEILAAVLGDLAGP